MVDCTHALYWEHVRYMYSDLWTQEVSFITKFHSGIQINLHNTTNKWKGASVWLSLLLDDKSITLCSYQPWQLTHTWPWSERHGWYCLSYRNLPAPLVAVRRELLGRWTWEPAQEMEHSNSANSAYQQCSTVEPVYRGIWGVIIREGVPTLGVVFMRCSTAMLCSDILIHLHNQTTSLLQPGVNSPNKVIP